MIGTYDPSMHRERTKLVANSYKMCFATMTVCTSTTITHGHLSSDCILADYGTV